MVGLFFITETEVPHKISKSNLELQKTFIIIDKHKRERGDFQLLFLEVKVATSVAPVKSSFLLQKTVHYKRLNCV
jgi:hypothetical protein